MPNGDEDAQKFLRTLEEVTVVLEDWLTSMILDPARHMTSPDVTIGEMPSSMGCSGWTRGSRASSRTGRPTAGSARRTGGSGGTRGTRTGDDGPQDLFAERDLAVGRLHLGEEGQARADELDEADHGAFRGEGCFAGTSVRSV